MQRKELVIVLWHTYLIQLSGVVGAFTVIGGALIWLYKKLVSEPDRRVAKEVQESNSRDLKDAIEPLSYSINLLNDLLGESQKDRKSLHKKDEEQGVVLYDHEKRISVMEDWRKGHKH